MLLRDFIREIKNTRNRFLSIFLIVLLGVMFFAGIRAAGPDMKLSADAYYDQENFMDIRVLSTLGLVDEDIEAIRKVEGVQNVAPSYSADLICHLSDSQPVIHCMALTDPVNVVTVVDGRLPQSDDEIFLDEKLINNYGIQIGDTLSFLTGSESGAVTDTLVHTEFTVVGYGNSPFYISLDRGTTTIGNGTVSGYAYLLSDSFQLEVYTELYLTVEGADDELCFGDEYEDVIETVKDRILLLEEERCQARYDSIMEEGNQKLADARLEIADAKEELSDAQKTLDDGRVQLDDGWKEYEDSKQQLADGRKTHEDSKQQLADGWKTYEDSKQQLADGRAEIDANRTTIESGQSQIAAAKAELASQKQLLEQSEAQLNAANVQLEEKEAELLAGEQQLAEALAQLEEGRSQLQLLRGQYEALKAQLESMQPSIPGPEEPEPGEGETGETADPSANSAYEELQNQVAQMEALLNEKEAELAAYEEELANQQAILDAGKEQLAAAKAEWEAGMDEVETGKAALAMAEEQLAQKEAELSAGLSKLQAAESELQNGQLKLQAAEAELQSGQMKLQEAEAKLLDGEAQLADAETTLLEKEQEWADGQQEYLEKSQEADEAIADAEMEIADGEKELEELEVPSWYVLGRDTLQVYVEYGQDTERIVSIGKVFPLIFFLVAALICLTTMTRMVEENRTQIGTLKALGYGKAAIAGKYLWYALLASFAGAVIGLFLGQKLLPPIIINAYKILYANLPVVQTPLYLSYSLSSSLVAIGITVAAAGFSCYQELREVPAALMRPEAPKAGKRILLEYITPLWNCLNFSRKAALRNLFRYKKRFFMTVLGIGGCMGLLLTGFGIKDSIMAIGEKQFGEIRIYSATLTLDEEATEEERQALYEKVAADPDVKQQMWALENSIDVGSGEAEKTSYLMVPKDLDVFSEFVKLKDRKSQETYTLGVDGVIISEKLATLLDVEAGDTIYLKDGDTNRIDVTVDSVAENYFYHYVYMSPALYEKLYGKSPEYSEILTINQEDDEDFENDFQETYMDEDAVLNVSFVSEMKTRVANMIKSMDTVIYVIVIAAGLLAFVVLYNLNNINITERRRELATLKVLGFFEGEVSMYVFRENVILTFIGALLGIVFGLILHRFVILTAEIDMMMFGRQVKAVSYFYSILLTFAFSFLVNLFMHFKLKKLNMVESMKSVE